MWVGQQKIDIRTLDIAESAGESVQNPEGFQILCPTRIYELYALWNPLTNKISPAPRGAPKWIYVQYGCSFSLFIGLAVIACVIVSLILVILVILLKRTTAEARNNPIKTRWEIFRISWGFFLQIILSKNDRRWSKNFQCSGITEDCCMKVWSTKS